MPAPRLKTTPDYDAQLRPSEQEIATGEMGCSGLRAPQKSCPLRSQRVKSGAGHRRLDLYGRQPRPHAIYSFILNKAQALLETASEPSHFSRNGTDRAN